MRYRIPYLGFCATTIALLVFLNSEQPFVLSQIIKVNLSLVGIMSSHLAVVDEVLSLVVAPFWGALSDKVGTRHVSVLGLLLLAMGIFLYPRMPSFFYLVLARAVFAIGASAVVSMITASLGELSLMSSEESQGVLDSNTPSPTESPGPLNTNTISSISSYNAFSDIEEGDQTVPLFESNNMMDEPFDAVLAMPRPNGKLAGYVGFFSGLGAIFAVAVLLPLPTYFDDSTHGLVEAFTIVAGGTVLLAAVFYFLLYQNPTRSWKLFVFGTSEVSVFDEAAVDMEGTVMSYFELMKEGWRSAQNDRRVALGYMGGMLSRATSVALALFLPMWVNNWYYEHGLCHQDDPEGCKSAITQAAILTGIANTVLLVAAPLAGYASDRYGSVFVMGLSTGVGILGVVGVCFLKSVFGAWPIIFASLIGASQSGTMTTSLSLTTDQRRVASGAVSGWYSFCGSLGVLVITLVGGFCYYLWDKAPFALLGIMLFVLMGYSFRFSISNRLRPSRSALTLR